ncbi:MAG: type I glyceraldehyde-3-phosphate dehydrogenase, partial [Candidatus Sericytochromatia bacterium]
MATRVAINGFGRIGRQVLRAALLKKADIEFVGVNDLTDAHTLAHLFKYDSVHRTYPGTVTYEGNTLIIDGKRIPIFAEKDPAALPWKDLNVDVVVESTGRFTDRDKAALHLQAGAKKVIISAPAKGEDITIVLGVNDDKYQPDNHHVISNASCTTNCLAPIAKVLHDTVGIERGFMTTIHSYTNDQRMLDQIHKDLRRARAGAANMIPTTTGAARAVGSVLPELNGKLDGSSVRVPTPNVSLVDLVFTPTRDTSVEELNAALKAAADGPMKGVLDYTDQPLVSSDFNHHPASSTIDSQET